MVFTGQAETLVQPGDIGRRTFPGDVDHRAPVPAPAIVRQVRELGSGIPGCVPFGEGHRMLAEGKGVTDDDFVLRKFRLGGAGLSACCPHQETPGRDDDHSRFGPAGQRRKTERKYPFGGRLSGQRRQGSAHPLSPQPRLQRLQCALFGLGSCPFIIREFLRKRQPGDPAAAQHAAGVAVEMCKQACPSRGVVQKLGDIVRRCVIDPRPVFQLAKVALGVGCLRHAREGFEEILVIANSQALFDQCPARLRRGLQVCALLLIDLQGPGGRQRRRAAEKADGVRGPAPVSKALCEGIKQAVGALGFRLAAPVYKGQALRRFETRRRLNPFQVNLDQLAAASGMTGLRTHRLRAHRR